MSGSSATDTTDRPVTDSLVTVFSSGSSCATSSIRLVIKDSTRSGPAPGKPVTTEAARIVKGGMLSRGIDRYPARPSTPTTSRATMVTRLLSRAKRVRFIAFSGLGAHSSTSRARLNSHSTNCLLN